MKIFLSWSGESSRRIASILHDWLPTVLQNVRPYMSAETIDKGQRWSVDIASQLEASEFGIICVTPQNMEAPWILFESGALSKSLEKGRVAPLIFGGLTPSDLSKSPLLQFQLTAFDKEELRKLLVSINTSAPEGEQITAEVVNRTFARAWAELETAVKEIDFSANLEPAAVGTVPTVNLSSSDIAIQELLSISRSQLKLLSAPEELLPEKYLIRVLGASGATYKPISRSHAAWQDLDKAVETLSGILEDSDAPELSESIKEAITQAMKDVKRPTRYLKQRLYGDPLGRPLQQIRREEKE